MTSKNIDMYLHHRKPKSGIGFTVSVQEGRKHADLFFEKNGKSEAAIYLPLEQLEALTEMLTIAKERIIETDKDEVNG